MNTQHPFEQRLADWLEDGPADAPAQILETVLAAIPSIPQRRAALRTPWRNASMLGFSRLAGIAAIVAIAVGAVLLRPGSPSGPVGAQNPSPSPSPSPHASPSVVPSRLALASVPVNWSTYVSSRFHYRLDYPADWSVQPAAADWPTSGFPDKDGQSLDIFSTTTNDARVFVSSVALKSGKTAAGWIAELDTWNASYGCVVSTPRTITIDGVSAREETLNSCNGSDHLLEVVMANDTRFYQINLFDQVGPFTETDLAILDRFLTSFHFGG